MEGYSIDAQKEFLVSFAKAKEFTEYEFYIDGGFSGKNLDTMHYDEIAEDMDEKDNSNKAEDNKGLEVIASKNKKGVCCLIM